MLTIEFQGGDKRYRKKNLKEVCFQCSVCALVCVVQNLKPYDCRNTFVYNVFGSNEPFAHGDIWACSDCHKCTEVCPQDVDPARVMADLRERSFSEGRAPESVRALMESVLTTGMGYPVTAKTLKDRENMGLDPPKTPPLDEIERIAELTGLSERAKALKDRPDKDPPPSESARRSPENST